MCRVASLLDKHCTENTAVKASHQGSGPPGHAGQMPHSATIPHARKQPSTTQKDSDYVIKIPPINRFRHFHIFKSVNFGAIETTGLTLGGRMISVALG